MRLRTYHGASFYDIMAAIRREMGENALIISTLETENGVQVTAALESEESPFVPSQEEEEEIQPVWNDLAESLLAQGIPASSLHVLRQSLPSPFPKPFTLRHLVEKLFRLTPLLPLKPSKKPKKPFLFIGTPGAGKTVVLGKVALQALLQGYFVSVITCDVEKAGRVAQLKTYTDAMEIPLSVVSSPKELKEEVASIPAESIILIDTPGINPYDPEEVDHINAFGVALRVSPLWVFAAGEDPQESIEKAKIFHGLGASRLILSKGDMVRRLGGALLPLIEKKMSLAGLSSSALISEGFPEITTSVFSQILMNARDTMKNDSSVWKERHHDAS